MSRTSIVIAGFPGIGKSYFASELNHRDDYEFVDLDPTPYSKQHDFPQNYMTEIQKAMKKPNRVILVGVHEPSRAALVEKGIPFTLVYPDKELKQEYMKRYGSRGNNPGFLELMDKKWDEFTGSCAGQRRCTPIVLGAGEFLSHHIDEILKSQKYSM